MTTESGPTTWAGRPQRGGLLVAALRLGCEMQKFLVLYRSTMSMGEQMAATTPQQRRDALDAWMAWGAGAGEALVDLGVPTQPTSDEDPRPRWMDRGVLDPPSPLVRAATGCPAPTSAREVAAQARWDKAVNAALASVR